MDTDEHGWVHAYSQLGGSSLICNRGQWLFVLHGIASVTVEKKCPLLWVGIPTLKPVTVVIKTTMKLHRQIIL
jgi:hypothetical protein